MRADVQAILSCSLTFGVPLVLALRELKLLRRGGGWSPDRIPDDETPRPLPPCLFVPPRDFDEPAPEVWLTAAVTRRETSTRVTMPVAELASAGGHTSGGTANRSNVTGAR
jgi:hypothetical protein